ncbi:Crp/Fnr family transcriptional regulator [Pontibacter rugosus]|uniref:Crp/Fnr family transcriptional regulator n=1 Tax=Pontibacter rugosus TaxID=1745966 RepID=A0ABW3SM73_9BACT
MKTDKLCQALLRLHPFPGELLTGQAQAALRAHAGEVLAESHYAQKQLLLSSGQPVDHAYFVADGFARGFCYNERTGSDITLFLWEEESFAVAANSFFLRQPSDIYLEVLPGSTLLSLSHGQLEEIFARFPPTERLARALCLHYNAFHQQRARDLLTRTAWERYQDLLATHPRVEQKVSQEVIASYLGITPWSLSRLKKRHR